MIVKTIKMRCEEVDAANIAICKSDEAHDGENGLSLSSGGCYFLTGFLSKKSFVNQAAMLLSLLDLIEIAPWFLNFTT